MKEPTDISNHNLVRNSNAYMSQGGKIYPNFYFLGLIILIKRLKKNFNRGINF